MSENHLCERLVVSARYLERQGMSVQHLRLLHHSMSRPETYRSTYRYFGENKELRQVNIDYANRIIFVAERHRQGKGALATLIEQALVRWPLRAA